MVYNTALMNIYLAKFLFLRICTFRVFEFIFRILDTRDSGRLEIKK